MKKEKAPGDMYTSAHVHMLNCILNCILAIYPPNGPKIQILKKMKKAPEDIIILRMCTKKL